MSGKWGVCSLRMSTEPGSRDEHELQNRARRVKLAISCLVIIVIVNIKRNWYRLFVRCWEQSDFEYNLGRVDMQNLCRIGFAGTDARTLLSAIVVSTAKSEIHPDSYKGVVVRGTSSMPAFSGEDIMNWPVDFLDVEENTAESYARSLIQGFESGNLDYVLPMPEALLFGGLVDELLEKGYGDRIAGLTASSSFVEADKIECKRLCEQARVPVADAWTEVDAGSYQEVCRVCLEYIHSYGGAVLKYPYSAGGKGARVISNTWEIREVYDTLLKDYKKDYKKYFKNNKWPLLIESRMSGVEISFTIFVDTEGNYQVLPTSLDYPERFSGQASQDNPITGGMGSISPHPFESQKLLDLVSERFADPFVEIMKQKGMLRPCVLYPGCFVSFSLNQEGEMEPSGIRVCEINIRPGEPEFQAVARRICNLGPLVQAMFSGDLDKVTPEVRENQLSLCFGLVVGPGGPDNQKGYPWSVTKYEPVQIDFAYMQKKNIQVIPSGMGYSRDFGFYSDGSRVAYCNVNGTLGEGQSRGDVAEKLRNRVMAAIGGNKIKVLPRENPEENRLALREDIGLHYRLAEKLMQTE